MNARSKNIMLMLGGIVSLALLLFAHRQTESDLWTAWQTDEYSHGAIIPFIAALLAWHQLAKEKPVLRPSWLAVPTLLLAALLQLISRLSAFGMTEEYGLVIGITGISLGFLGRRATITLAPALVYLLFAVPLPHLIQANLSQGLQLLSSTLGVMPLDWLGIPVFQEGNVIDLGGYKLQVVDACSGLRYLFPLLSFSYLIAFLLKDKMWKRLIIFLSAIPITIGLNSLRITIIGITVDKWGPGMAEGFIHAFEGWVIFMVCIGILMGETWILRRIGSRGTFRYEYFGLAHGPYSSGRVERSSPPFATILITLALAVLFGMGSVEQLPEIIPAHPPMSGFPTDLGDWHGRAISMESDVLNELKLSDYWLADYKHSDQPPVNFYIAYYASQRVGTTTHSPSNCIPGGGWRIEKSDIISVPLPDGPLNVTRLLIRRGTSAELVYYWFDERGRDLTETTNAKWHLLWDSILMHRSDGALVRLVTPLSTSENEADAEARLNAFLTLARPEMKHFIPGADAINAVAEPKLSQ
ncbi:MAG TPA: VPLPA-CTERM-specific exosortase XrtD [Alphaproteobacteria bacterium]|nr:VPLPA-CTERM-specific exosortase XrtD [Alphaproteobacteria bacterium]